MLENLTHPFIWMPHQTLLKMSPWPLVTQ
jgi:hypothetical protein